MKRKDIIVKFADILQKSNRGNRAGEKFLDGWRATKKYDEIWKVFERYMLTSHGSIICIDNRLKNKFNVALKRKKCFRSEGV